MANSKRKCKGCNRYLRQDRHDWRQSPVGWFHTKDCQIKYARKQVSVQKKAAKQKAKRDHRKARAELYGLTNEIKKCKLIAQECAAWRDNMKPCITCGMGLMSQSRYHLTRWDGGHFRSVGSMPSLQLDLRNIHGQCRSCNGFKGGMPGQFEANLIERYGQAYVDRLNAPQPIKNYTYDYLERYARVIRKLTRRYKARNNGYHMGA